MEDVLNVYNEPQQPQVARLCVDERPCQLVGDLIAPMDMKAGKSKRIDYEYVRQGVCCVFMAYDMDRGQRYVQVREQRTKQDYAQFMDWVVSQHYSGVEKIVVVQDNLNTHTKGSFYEHLPQQRAGELARRMEFHYTPKHGSWLNQVEIEFSVMVRQCLDGLDRRIGSVEQLKAEVGAWAKARNSRAVKIHWSFTVDKAREKMASQYQKVNPDN